MTLTQRVRAASGHNVAEAGNGREQGSAQYGFTDDIQAPSGDTHDRGNRLTTEELRRAVHKKIPFESIATIMVDSPERARNELRAACRQVLSDTHWSELSSVEKAQLTEELIDLVFGMGPIEGLIYDESVTEIMVNGARSIYFERDGKLHRSNLAFESDEQVRVLIDRIIGPLGRRIDESSPMVNARLPQGHRVNAVIPPLALDGPLLTIRAFTRYVMTLEEMAAGGSFNQDVMTFLRWLIIARKNVVVSGGTGSGKTTMLNALSCMISHDERIITVEDSAELKFLDHPHVVRLEARPRNAEGEGEITIRDLVTNALRMRPDRIIVGECRGGEALDMLQAMNTGHDGSLTTLHANTPVDVIDRMVTMVHYAVDLPIDAIEAQIGSAFDYIVQVARAPDGGRYVSEISEVFFNRTTRRCEIEKVYSRDPRKVEGIWHRKPLFLLELVSHGLATQEEVRSWQRLTRLPF